MSDEILDPLTGDTSSDGLVPLDLAAMSEDELLAMFPTPVQAAGALLHARAVARRVPRAMKRYRADLRQAERDLVIALATASRDLLTQYPRMVLSERRDLARAVSDDVKAAQDRVDEAWLLLEYARDWDKAIGRDIDILRSLNANLRGEHK